MLAPFRQRPIGLILTVFLPFVAGYYLSYLFRTINALIAPNLIHDLRLDAADLGLLTSAYFLSFAAVQLPLGVLLDRFGPRRVQAPLMIVAGCGAFLFAIGHHPLTVFAGRILIGVGVAGALMSGLKALALSFPRERLSLLNGWFIMLGAMGAVTATEPSAAVLGAMGWRGLFFVLSAASVVVGVGVYLAAPYAASADPASGRRGQHVPGLREIYTDRRFLRLAPLSASCISAAWALQGLWAERWLADVNHYSEQKIVGHLFVMACALSLGAGLLGTVADRLRRHGIPLTRTFGCAALALIGAEMMLILQMPVSSYVLWAVVAGFGAMTVLSYAILGECFPKESVGRANAALNILHIGGAFVLQFAIGLIVVLWPPDSIGRYPILAYQLGLALPIGLQVVAVLWFTWTGRSVVEAAVHLVAAATEPPQTATE